MRVDGERVKRECTAQGLDFAAAPQGLLSFIKPDAHGDDREE